MKNYVLVFVIFGLFSVVSVVAQTKPSTSPSENNLLEFGNTVEREIANGQKHIYKIKINAGQFAKFEADQHASDVVFSFISPEGFNLLEFKNETKGDGLETAKVAVETSGEYELRVLSFHTAKQNGTYRLKFAELRSATDQEISFSAGMRLTDEGVKLTRENATAESIKLGMTKFSQAVEKFRYSDAARREGIVLRNIGALYDRLGNRSKGVEYAFSAFERFRQAKWQYGEFKVFQDLGHTYLTLGEPEKAIESLHKATALLPEVGIKGEEATTLIAFGKIYERIGDFPRAANYYQQALTAAKEDGEKPNIVADANRNLGRIFWALGDIQKAQMYFQTALDQARANKYRPLEAAVLSNLSRIYFAFGDAAKALEMLDDALKISRDLGDKLNEAATLKSLGQVYLDLAETSKALETLNQSLTIYRSVEDKQNLAETLLGLARAESRKGNLDAAQANAEEAVSLIETIRSRVQSAEWRDSFSANLQDFYGFYVELLMQRDQLEPSKNFAALALQANERARARGLLNLLTEANANIREGVEAKLLSKEIEIKNLLSARMENLTRVLSGKSTPEQTAKLTQEIEQIRADYEQTQAQIRQTSPRYAALTQPKTLSLTEIQTEVLDTDSVLLEYALGEKESFLWIVTKDSFQTIELPKRAEIENLARLTYETLVARNKRVKFETTEERRARIEQADLDFLDYSKALSKAILAPAEKFLTKKRLLIVADGALQYVPFASLIVSNKGQRTKDEARFLIENHEIINLPSASTLAILRREMNGRPLAPKTLAVLADPVFDTKDERFQMSGAKKKTAPKFETVALTKNTDGNSAKNLKRAVSDFDFEDEEGINLPRLPFTRREADSISASLPANQRSKMLDFDATRNAVFNAGLSNYRFVHFATHSFLNNKNPELSGIVLSLFDENGKEQDGFLRVGEVFNLKLPAELVVLSGCRTGLGKEIKGEGLVGLTRGFMYAGAKRVVVSLWDVNDEGTSKLMANFYHEMLGAKKPSPASALRQAQISMLKDKRWQNPYFWATFTLQGEPR